MNIAALKEAAIAARDTPIDKDWRGAVDAYRIASKPSAILSLIERAEQMQKALRVFGAWAIDVSTLRTLEQLEADMNEVGVSLQQVGEWLALSNPTETVK